MKKILLLLLIFVSGCTGVFAQQFDYGKIAPHPRLLLPEGGEEAIKKAIAEYPPLAAVHQRIMELCDRTLTESPVERIKEGASVIWEVEHWSLLRQTLTHFLLCSVVCLPIAWAMGWMADQPGWYLFGFVAMYAGIWLINYLQIRRRVREINERLKQV